MMVVIESSDRVVSLPESLGRRRDICLPCPVDREGVVISRENTLAKLILDQHGSSTYDFFKVWPDKSYFFSDSRQSFISYTISRGVALVLGDPVGPDSEILDTARSFMKYCSKNGWLVCFLLTDRISMYTSLGLSIMKTGEEAVVDLDHFCACTAKAKYFRYHQKRFERRGYNISRYMPPHSMELLSEVEDISKEWLTIPQHRELGFIQGRFSRDYIEQTIVDVVRDPEGRAIAFVNEVRSYKPGEATFDMMRQRPGVPNGTMDYLMHGMMLILKQEGYRSFNMGLAPFAGLGRRPGAPLVEKIVQILFRMNWFISNQGIYNYKVKFEPQWNDCFGAYQGGILGVFRIVLAAARVVEGK